MPITRRIHTSKSSQGAERRVSLFSSPAKGATFPYAELVSKTLDQLESGQLVDPFFSAYEVPGVYTPLMPIYAFEKLARLPFENNTLRQCIESMVVNIDSYGHNWDYIGPENQEDSDEAQEEKARLSMFISDCSPDWNFQEVRERSRWDYETIGWAAYEISRDRRGRIVMMDHIPSITLRMSKREVRGVEMLVDTPNPDEPGTYVRKRVVRHFRRFIQIGYAGQRVYFKEFGDPRPINPRNGEVDINLPVEEQATEVLIRQMYVPGQVYALPRWIGGLPVILGSRESEIVNLNFFRENAIPALAVLVSGGALTRESFEIIQEYITAVRGQRAMHRVMVLEASADDHGSTDHSNPSPKIDLKPMTSERQQEGLFQDYDQKNIQKVRSLFRLPPIYAGRAEDYTRASAYASMLTAEQQVFLPERMSWDNMFNLKVLKSMHPKFWRLKSLGPPLTEPETMSKLLDTFEKTGAMTPNIVIKLANRMLDIDIPGIKEAWGNAPFTVVMANIRAGNTVFGLQDFIDQMAPMAVPGLVPGERPPDDPNAGGPSQNPKPSKNTTGKPAGTSSSSSRASKVADLDLLAATQETIRREIGNMVSDLREAIAEGFQDHAISVRPA